MSWDQNYDNSGYGNYNDNSQYGGYGGGQSNSQSYNYDNYGQQPQQQQQQPQPGIYNPNDYSGYQQPPQPSPSPAQSGYGQMPPQGQGPQSQVPGFAAPYMNPVMADMAQQYGQAMMDKGQEEIKKNLDKYVSIGQLKYYFAVDNAYVGKKLGLLLFPFAQSNWSIQYSHESQPVQPKFDVNAPDLYIPSMAYLTFILLAGYILGLRNSFSPDLLATTASSVFAYLLLELICIYLTLHLMNISTNMCKWDILSFSTYKYVAMIFLTLMGLLFQSTTSYYAALIYTSGALSFFLVRTLKLRIEPEAHGMQVHGKRKLYMILFYAGLQPLLIWLMTRYFAPLSIDSMPQAPPQPLA